jgi:hypothetical protein
MREPISHDEAAAAAAAAAARISAICGSRAIVGPTVA